MSARDEMALPDAGYSIRPKRCYVWTSVVEAPEVSAVLVWDRERGLPHAAYFDPDENCWNSLHDGARIEGVTEWMDFTAPTASTPADMPTLETRTK